jgi:hypothetical protein
MIWKERLLNLAMAMAGGVIGGVLVTAALTNRASSTRPAVESVTAKNFVLLDHTGKRRAAWSVSTTGVAGFDILDHAGLSRAQLGVRPDGDAIFSLSGDNGKPVAVMSTAASSGAATLAFFNSNGATRAEIGLKQGDPSILLYDHDGYRLLRIEVREELPAIALHDRRGNWRSLLTLDSDGSPEFALADQNARPRAMLGLQPDGRSTFALSTDTGGALALLTQMPDGGPSLRLFSRDGTIVGQMP